MKLILPPDTTSQIVHVFILDSAATDGNGKTAPAFGDHMMNVLNSQPKT